MKQTLWWRVAVKTNGWLLLLAVAAMIIVLAGCGGSTANVQNPPPPSQSQVAIAFQTQPAPSIAVSFSENVTAVVTNDPGNYGVDWLLTCQVDPNNVHGLCGSLSAPANGGASCNNDTSKHTASGCPITYTAPSTLSTNSTVVEVVAYATANSLKNTVAPITVTTFNSGLSGSYVLEAGGVDSGFNPYQFAGVVVLDGNGGISGGEQTVNFFDPFTGVLVSKSDAIVSRGSSYFLGSDGRGTLTLNPNYDTDIGTESFSLVFLSSSQALISALPTSNLTISATGTMDLQPSAPAAPSGGYAFSVGGSDVSKAKPLAFGGVFNIDSPNTISGNGSVADEILARKVLATATTLSGTITAPDQFGAVTLNLTAGFGNNGKPLQFQLTGYVVDNTHIKLIESDDSAGATSPFGLTAGLAVGQGAATGTFTTNATFSGSYVFEVLGIDLSSPPGGTPNIVPATLTSVGVLTADGSGNLSNGFADTFLELNTAQGSVSQPQSGAQISAAFSGTYAVDTIGTGRTTLILANFNPNPKHGYQPVFFLYLAGNGNPALVLQGGDQSYPSIGAGIAYPQSIGNLAFSGDYGLNFTQQYSSASSENDGTAQMNVTPTTNPPSLSGFADLNLSFSPNPDQLFTGTFSTMGANGVFPGILGTNNASQGNNNSFVFNPPIAVDYYAIDSSHGFFVETDLVTAVAPEVPGQVSLGYYVTRTPVCSGCP